MQSGHPDEVPSRPGGLKRPEFIALVALMMALNASAVDIMLPAFPNIASDLGLADANRVQYVLLSYLIGFGIGQLFYGPVSDRFGRRAPLLFALAVYLACAVAGALAPTFEFLLAARFVQGLGAAGTRVIALSVVRDTHSGRAMASTMSLVMMVFMVVPIIAPATGQAIILFTEWHGIFYFMAIMAVGVGLWAWLRLPETLHEEFRRELTPASVIQGFRLVLSNRITLFYTLSSSFYFGSLFAFLNMAQPVYVDIFGLGTLFPIAFSAVACFMAVSSFVNSRMVMRFGQRRISHAALMGYFALATLLATLSATIQVPFWLFFSIMVVMMPLFGFVGANFNSIAMEPLGALAGTAASVLGFSQTVIGALVGALVGQAYDGTLLPLTLGFAVISGLSLILLLIGEKGRLFGTSAA